MSRNGLFEALLRTEPLFKNKEVLRHSYTPDELPHRAEQVSQLAQVLVAALRGETPSNVFIYGKTGTGKTAVARYVGKELHKAGQAENRRINYIYINCEVVDTQYRVLTQIANHFIQAWSDRIPFTGWPTDEVYSKLREKIEESGGVTVIILDEVDKLVFKSGDDVLYNLSRINGELHKSRVNVIGISNDLKFTEFLDHRVRSSLGEEEIIFPPYDARQLQDILNQRAAIAFKEDVLEVSVVPLCSALAAQEHGDARRALDMLRVSGELAEREGARRIGEAHVRRAQHKIELDRVTEVVRTLPTQSKLVLLAGILSEEAGNTGTTTGEIYNVYSELCRVANADVLTQRRVTDLLSELDMMGILNARVISKGRYGRTKEIQLSVPLLETKAVLREDPLLEAACALQVPKQSRLGMGQLGTA